MSIELIKEMVSGKESQIGVTETQYFTFDRLYLECGEMLSPVTIAYETYGKLNEKKDNAILICHALSGDAHAAGISRKTKNPGWWDSIIGPGNAFDTERYFVICSNVIGGCGGSTGPSTVNPATGRPYGLSFPIITIRDMVNAQVRLLEHLEIDRLVSVAGGSMGGMQVLEWMASHPHRIKSAIPIATAARHSPQQIAFNEVGRIAIMADPNWKLGNYYDGQLPARGLAVARMIGHITYMSDVSMERKFGRKFSREPGALKFAAEFEVEGYLHKRGNHFVERFDANSYLYISKAMDYFDVFGGKERNETFAGMDMKTLIISFTSDWLYPAHQSREIVNACKAAGLDATYAEIDSSYGHDAFLVETAEEERAIKYFLEKIS